MVGALGAAGAGQGAGGSLTAADYIEIQQLYARYARTLDLGDPEGWADTFTPDGVFRDAAGREELVAYAENSYGGRQGTGRHWNSQLVVTPTAVAICSCSTSACSRPASASRASTATSW